MRTPQDYAKIAIDMLDTERTRVTEIIQETCEMDYTPSELEEELASIKDWHNELTGAIEWLKTFL